MLLVPEVIIGVLAILILIGSLSGPPHPKTAERLSIPKRAFDQTSPNVMAAGAGAVAHAAGNTGASGSGMKTELDKQGIRSAPTTR